MKKDQLQRIAISLLQNKEIDRDLYNLDVKLLIKYFIENKISFIEINNRKNNKWIEEFLLMDIVRIEINKEQVLYDSWKEDFLIIKDVWQKNGIDYIFHKSVGVFPYLSDNLDVMVRESDFVKAGQLLKELDYINLRNIQEEHKEFYRKFIGDTVVGPIHLHERVCWVVPFEDVEHLWNNRIQSVNDSLVYYPDYEDGILINSAHCFLEDHIIKLKDILYIKHCVDSKSINWKYITETANILNWELSLHTVFIIFNHLYEKLFNNSLFSKDVLKKSQEYVNNHPWVRNKLDKIVLKDATMPFKIPHLWVRRHTALRELKDKSFGSIISRVYQVSGGLLDRLIHLKFKLHNQPGMFIAFTGIDGGGKSKHIDTLTSAFNKCDIKTKYIWFRVGSLPVTNFLTKKLKSKNRIMDKAIARNDILLKYSFIVRLWKVVNTLELLFYYSIYIRVLRISNKVIICDRYYLDAIVDLESIDKKYIYNRFIYKLMKQLAPKPEFYYYIKTTTDLIRDRAKEEVLEDIDNNYTFLEKIIKEVDIITIDNSLKFDQVSSELIKYTLSNFFAKYPKKYRNYKVVSFRYK